MGANLFETGVLSGQVFDDALSALQHHNINLVCKSRYYKTPCFPAGAGPDYINACAQLSFDGSASELLHILHRVEADFGRIRETRWGSRSLDLDLLFAENQIIPNSQTVTEWINLPLAEQQKKAPDLLILPHPRIQDRAFVLHPLMDIAPNWLHPLLKKTVRDMHNALPAQKIAEITAI